MNCKELVFRQYSRVQSTTMTEDKLSYNYTVVLEKPDPSYHLH